MDIIKERRKKREEIINKVSNALNKLVEKYGKEGLKITFESIITSIQANFYCTRRTASEYANISLYKSNLSKSNLSYNKDYTMRLEIE